MTKSNVLKPQINVKNAHRFTQFFDASNLGYQDVSNVFSNFPLTSHVWSIFLLNMSQYRVWDQKVHKSNKLKICGKNTK